MKYDIMKAVEHSKLPVKFRKSYPTPDDLVKAGWWLQMKYDGCMGIATMEPDRPGRMESRTGEDYSTSCGHIIEELREALILRKWPFTPCVIIGEVWQHASEASFPEVSGKFRRQKERSPELKFMVHDILPISRDTDEAYRLRYADLCELLPLANLSDCACHVAYTHHGIMDPRTAAATWQRWGGYDGAILRDPNAGYHVGMVKAGEIVKVKPVRSLDLRIVETIQVAGEKTGRAVYTIKVMYNGVPTFVGSGVPHEKTWKNGDIVEVEFLEVTPSGSLREPRFKSIRFDKKESD